MDKQASFIVNGTINVQFHWSDGRENGEYISDCFVDISELFSMWKGGGSLERY